MNWRKKTAKTAWTATLDQLAIRGPINAESLLGAYVEQVRGHALILVDTPDAMTPSGPSGMWLPGEGFDIVWCNPRALHGHRDHVLLHELGHMVNGDEAEQISPQTIANLVQAICRHTGSRFWSSVMTPAPVAHCRTEGPSTGIPAKEVDAEGFAYHAATWIRQRPADSPPSLVGNLYSTLDTNRS